MFLEEGFIIFFLFSISFFFFFLHIFMLAQQEKENKNWKWDLYGVIIIYTWISFVNIYLFQLSGGQCCFM